MFLIRSIATALLVLVLPAIRAISSDDKVDGEWPTFVIPEKAQRVFGRL